MTSDGIEQGIDTLDELEDIDVGEKLIDSHLEPSSEEDDRNSDSDHEQEIFLTSEQDQ